MEVMARYGCFGDDSAAADVARKMGRIMLKYRPIAPKPVNSGGAVTAVEEARSSSKRGKKRKTSLNSEKVKGRKYFKKAEESNNNNNNNNFVTLSLMPVTPERKEESPSTPTPSPTPSDGHVAYFQAPVVVVAPRPVRPVGSWVTVECVTDTWRYGEGAGGGVGLEEDTCPVFLSDGGERVTWTNAAYRRMVVGPAGEEGEEVRVALVSRGLVPEEGVTCFTCRVRVRYACRRRGKVTMAVPCDAWRVGEGRIVWRLDVKAALSLSNSLVC